jgi:exopolysaccharide biosynthesis polyprenyl glycosylphosphotransferase
MIARQQEIRLQVNQLIDAVLLGGVFWLCHWVRHSGLLVLDALNEIPAFDHFLWMLAVIMPFGPFLLELQGYYQHPLEKTVWKSLHQIARAGLWLGLIIGGAVIFLRLTVPSRSVLILFCIAAPVTLILKERIYAWLRLMKLKQGESGERIILAGEQERMREIVRTLSLAQRLEVRIVERIDLEVCEVSELVNAIHRHSVGRVILAFSRLEMDKVQRAIEACEVEGVEAWLSADFIRTSVARPTYENLGGRPMLVFRATPDLSWALLVKGLIDRVGAFVGLVVLSPLFVILAILVRLSSPGPAFFSQRRAGIHGRPFTMWKFRSMFVDAEKRHAELLSRNEMSGPVFKIENDPRVTPIGRFLRKTSLDELPQLLNVLQGDMSLVGPRPLPLYEVESFSSAAHRRRLSMKPGLTCLWQVRGRNNVRNFDDWVKMDLEYIDNWSLRLDFKILLMTIPAVLKGYGAK